MMIKKILRSFLMVGILLSPLCAGEVTVKNETAVTINVTIRGKQNQSTSGVTTITRDVLPGKTETVTLEDNKCEGVTFSVQGVTVTALPVLPLQSNECVLSGCEGQVVFKIKTDGSALVCAVTHVGN